MGIETETDETADETKPLVSGQRSKRPVMATISNGSNQSGCSDADDEIGVVEKYCSHMDEKFKRLVLQALKNIDVNCPTLITGGSSGSYFIHDENNVIIAVFKPEDEEPYGINNPKWGKWFQKVFIPCSFGRGCLVPNQGYVSEAAAYIVDEFFKFNVVPPTAVVGLASKVFNYSRLERYQARAKQRIASRFPDLENRFNWSKAYKKKRGSFQTFMHGYMDPDEFNRLYPIDTLSEEEKKTLTIELQKMFALDYLIRNTDRLSANYLIKVIDVEGKDFVVPESKSEAKEIIIDISSEPSSSQAYEQFVTESGEKFVVTENSEKPPLVHAQTIPESHTITPAGDVSQQEAVPQKPDRFFKIACIDNGLAFPFKHPSDIRSYPFSWAKYFPYFASQPFVPEVKEVILRVLQNVESVKDLCQKVEAQFNADKRFRKKKTIKSQLSVFRGQMFNLLKALENNQTLAQLEMKRPYYAKEMKKKKKRPSHNRRPSQNVETVHIEISSDDDDISIGPQTPAVELWKTSFQIKKHTKNPYFSCF